MDSAFGAICIPTSAVTSPPRRSSGSLSSPREKRHIEENRPPDFFPSDCRLSDSSTTRREIFHGALIDGYRATPERRVGHCVESDVSESTLIYFFPLTIRSRVYVPCHPVAPSRDSRESTHEQLERSARAWLAACKILLSQVISLNL